MTPDNFIPRGDPNPFRYPDPSLSSRPNISLKSRISARGSLVGLDWREKVFEAELEAKAIAYYETLPRNSKVFEQPKFVEYIDPNTGRRKRHTYDLLVETTSGRKTFVQVKPAAFVSDAFMAEMTVIASYAGTRADDWEIFSDRCPHPRIVSAALDLFSARRDPPTELDDRVAALTSDLAGAVPIAWIVSSIGDGNAFRAVLRQIGSGVLKAASPGRITPNTLVTLAARSE